MLSLQADRWGPQTLRPRPAATLPRVDVAEVWGVRPARQLLWDGGSSSVLKRLRFKSISPVSLVQSSRRRKGGSRDGAGPVPRAKQTLQMGLSHAAAACAPGDARGFCQGFSRGGRTRNDGGSVGTRPPRRKCRKEQRAATRRGGWALWREELSALTLCSPPGHRGSAAARVSKVFRSEHGELFSVSSSSEWVQGERRGRPGTLGTRNRRQKPARAAFAGQGLFSHQ